MTFDPSTWNTARGTFWPLTTFVRTFTLFLMISNIQPGAFLADSNSWPRALDQLQYCNLPHRQRPNPTGSYLVASYNL